MKPNNIVTGYKTCSYVYCKDMIGLFITRSHVMQGDINGRINNSLFKNMHAYLAFYVK